MNITQEDKGLTANLKIQIVPADYTEKVEASLKDYRKKVKIDGFRPGTAPVGLIKKTYGRYVLVDEVNKLISESLNSHITDNKLAILGEPLPNEAEQKEIDWDKDTEFEFTFEVAFAPEVTVEIPKKGKTTYYKIVADDKMIDEQVDHLCARFGSQSSADEIEGTEIVKGTLTQQNSENPHIKENASLLLTKVATEAELGVFKGAKKGSTVTFNPKKAFENEVEIAAMLATTKENQDLINADYALEITDILRFTKSEVNQELFDKVFGEGTISDEAGFRAKIKEDFETRMIGNSDYKLLLDVKKKLIETNDIVLADEFLKRWLLETNKENDKVTPDQIELEFPRFLEDLRWQLISGKLIKDNNLTVTEDDIKNGAKEYTRMQFAQFGMMNPSDEDLEHWSKEIIKNRKEAQQIFEAEQDKKLMAYFKENIKLTEVEKSIEEFNALFEAK